MLAQRYPDAFDGIAAGAPGISWTELLPYLYWSQQIMNELDYFPYKCEFIAITDAAIAECDELDGVKDGLITNVDECMDVFDPSSVVGKSVKCSDADGKEVKVSKEAAKIAKTTWDGMPYDGGRKLFTGIRPGANLVQNGPDGFLGVADTNCTQDGCVGAPNYLGANWLQLFLARDPDFDLSSLSRKEFDDFVRFSGQQYSSFISTTDPDLSRFRDAGGKMVTFHGLVSWK